MKEDLQEFPDLTEPDPADEAMYKAYLYGKLRAAEQDVREGRIVAHEEVVAETARWFAGND